MEFNVLIKSIRQKQGITQKELAKNIMSQSSYSKFENGTRSVSSEELNKITEKLKINATDLNDIFKLENTEISLIRTKLHLALRNKLPIQEIERIYEFTKSKKDTSIHLYRYYLYIQKRFHHLSNKIDKISTSEINDIFNQLQNNSYWTNYYIQIIMDFTLEFTTEQLIYILNRLEKYDVERMSPIDSTILHLLPSALSNIADALIDISVKDNNKKLLIDANRACNKLQEILIIMPSVEFELLLKLSQVRSEFFKASNKKEKEIATEKIKTFLSEIQTVAKIRNNKHQKILSITDPIEKSLTSILDTQKPSKETHYFII